MSARDSLRLFGGGRVTEQAATIQLLSGARAARLSGATSAQWDDLVDDWRCRGGTVDGGHNGAVGGEGGRRGQAILNYWM